MSKYVVLKVTREQIAEAVEVEASGDEQAVRKVYESATKGTTLNEMALVAVPARSFHPVLIKTNTVPQVSVEPLLAATGEEKPKEAPDGAK